MEFIQKINKVIILCGTEKLQQAITRLLHYVFGFKKDDIYHLNFENTYLLFSLVKKIKENDLWIIEGINPKEVENPVGWRTAKNINAKVLILFLTIPKKEIKKYFIYFPCDNLKQKIEDVLKNEKPEAKDFNEIEEKWSALKWRPTHRHHSNSS